MNISVEKWLCCLPFAEEQAWDGIVVTGRLTAGEVGYVHCLVGELRLSFLPEDITAIEPLVAPDLLLPEESKGLGSVATVRILIRRRAPVQDIRPSELCERALPERRPFALSVRPRVITLGPRTRFRDLEREFLSSQLLVDA
jgi:hypothetical protein